MTRHGHAVDAVGLAAFRGAPFLQNRPCRGSFIFGLPSDQPSTFDATVALAEQADMTFAQFVLLTPFQPDGETRLLFVHGH